jgi:transcription elongation factor Elf1
VSLWVEQTFVQRLCVRFRNFKQQKPLLWNFSCPICGDSKKNERKARGYIYEKKQALMYRCHNCGAGHTFGNFMRLMDPVLYDEYKMELFKDRAQNEVRPPREAPDDVREVAVEKAPKKPPSIFRYMQPVGQLDEDHVAVQYLSERAIPKNKWKYFFYVEKYWAWIHKVKPGGDLKRAKYLQEKHEHPRLIIPYFDADFNIFRITARALDDQHEPKYLFTVLDDEKPSLYNYDFIDRDQTVYVVEGQIDSLFLPNCIAVGNANYGSPELRQLHDKVIVPDNQPRNPEVVKNIKAAVDMGYPICIWDKVYGKDLNDMFKLGYSLEEIKQIIDRNTYVGAAALLKFSEWKRC